MPPSPILVGLLIAAIHGVGFACAVHVLITGRTPQGALAWIFFLILMPYAAIPLYWVFGPRRYAGYIDARLRRPSPLSAIADELIAAIGAFVVDQNGTRSTLVALERIVHLPFTRGNHIELLIDGAATFESFFAAIRSAEDYIAVQFFIVHDDEIGRRMKDELAARACAGVQVLFLYDEIGSRALPDCYRNDLRRAGVRIEPFSTTRHSNRFQINFRNHRKLLIVDGLVGFVGGINCGDEYLGRNPKFSPWRDTFARIEGPSVQALQLSFVEDWHWATDELPDWNWQPAPCASGADQKALVLPTGPADIFESCNLLFVALIHSAATRLWISTPYFVFDNQILSALQLAGLRGVDVRILVPERGDHAAVHYAGCSFHQDVLESDVRIFQYQEGFLHQKAMLVDDDLALLGTMNLDNRSMRLNFELGVLVEDCAVARDVETMLISDFRRAAELRLSDLESRSLRFRLASRAARLCAPIL